LRGGLRAYFGTSANDKEKNGVPNGSSFVEMDTGARFLFDEEEDLWRKQTGASSGSGSGGVSVHAELSGRDLPGQHPVAAIDGLQDALDQKLDAEDVVEIPGEDVLDIWNSI